jgi:hypothetical protein
MLKLTPIILGIATVFTIGDPTHAATGANLGASKLETQVTSSLYARTTVNPVERRREEEWKQQEEWKRKEQDKWHREEWRQYDRGKWKDNRGKWRGKKRGWHKHRRDWHSDRERHWHK